MLSRLIRHTLIIFISSFLYWQLLHLLISVISLFSIVPTHPFSDSHVTDIFISVMWADEQMTWKWVSPFLTDYVPCYSHSHLISFPGLLSVFPSSFFNFSTHTFHDIYGYQRDSLVYANITMNMEASLRSVSSSGVTNDEKSIYPCLCPTILFTVVSSTSFYPYPSSGSHSVITLSPSNQLAPNQLQLAQMLATPQTKPERNHMTKTHPNTSLKRLSPLPSTPSSCPFFP